MTTNLESFKDKSPFHYQTENIASSDEPSLLPRSGWNSQVTYLRVLFRVKKRLDEIEESIAAGKAYKY